MTTATRDPRAPKPQWDTIIEQVSARGRTRVVIPAPSRRPYDHRPREHQTGWPT